MVVKLTKILPNFSKVGQMQCFLHIVNLVAKSIIRQFNVQKKQDNEHLNEAEQELHDLEGNVDLENKHAEDLLRQYQIYNKTHIGDESNNDVKE
jgi:hypothetical protein